MYLEHYATGVRADPELWCDEWADQFARIPAGLSMEAGKYRIDRTPLAREIHHVLSPNHPAKRIVTMVASQMFKTQTYINAICSYIHRAPGNILVLLPSDNLVKRVSNRLEKTIRAIPELDALVARPRSRDTRNSINMKEFKGGTLYIYSSGSTRNIQEVPIRYLIGDEVAQWEHDIGGQGDMIKVAEARTTTAGRRAKLFYPGTPTSEETPAHELWEMSDKRLALVPCPHCDYMQPLVIEQLVYRGPEEPTTYCCEHCGKDIEEKHKTRMFAAHRWEATAKGDGETLGYHAGQLYLPYGWTSWVEIAGLHEAAKSAQKDGDHDAMKAFYNVRLGLPWSERSATTSAEDIKATADGPPLGKAPKDCALLTAAVDVQGNRLEADVYGWSWNDTTKRVEVGPVQRWRIAGGPQDKSTYEELLALLDAPIQRIGGGSLTVTLCFIDAGNWTQDVIDFSTRNKSRVLANGRGQQILPIRGENRYGTPIISRTPDKVEITKGGRIRRSGGKVWRIGTDTAKDWISKRVTNGVLRWAEDLPLEFFEQLTAEVRRTKRVSGRRVSYWTPIVAGARNEALDLCVYNIAAGYYLDLLHKPKEWWKSAKIAAMAPAKKKKTEAPAEKTEERQKPRERSRASPQMNKRRGRRLV